MTAAALTATTPTGCGALPAHAYRPRRRKGTGGIFWRNPSGAFPGAWTATIRHNRRLRMRYGHTYAEAKLANVLARCCRRRAAAGGSRTQTSGLHKALSNVRVRATH